MHHRDGLLQSKGNYTVQFLQIPAEMSRIKDNWEKIVPPHNPSLHTKNHKAMANALAAGKKHQNV